MVHALNVLLPWTELLQKTGVVVKKQEEISISRSHVAQFDQ